jgi:TatA/E family protein of Tat protein translocase
MGNLGWPEILIILGIALIIFGPRKLPELGKSLGQSLAQFRRASEDFKRTWEDEVEMEKHKIASLPQEITDYGGGEAPGRVEPDQQAETPPVEESPAAEEPPALAAEQSVEPAEQTAAAAEQGETVAQEARRDWA